MGQGIIILSEGFGWMFCPTSLLTSQTKYKLSIDVPCYIYRGIFSFLYWRRKRVGMGGGGGGGGHAP